jgi:hypothetical protein
VRARSRRVTPILPLDNLQYIFNAFPSRCGAYSESGWTMMGHLAEWMMDLLSKGSTRCLSTRGTNAGSVHSFEV